jgi:pimeloyl-ACP methyl ester carboxylesterase
MLKRLLLTLLLALLAGGVLAQDEAGEIVLIPFSDVEAGVEGVVPSGWEQFSTGLWLRSGQPQALIAQQGVISTLDQIVPALLQQLGLAELPEPTGLITANELDWVIYESNGPTGTTIVVDFALSTKGASVYLIILQSDAAERDALREAVFIPAVEALKPLETTPVVPDDATYTAENVTFNNGAITLAGTLTMPEGEGPHPAIVLISGSGPQDRDERLQGIGFAPFAVIADHLTRAGIAVLRYDDRGVGQSGGDFNAATTADFAADAQAALAYLQSRPEINAAQVGVLGHSEGGSVAAHLAAAGADTAFYVLMAGPAVNGADLLVVQNQRIYAAENLSEEESAAQVAFVEEMFPLVIAGDSAALTTLLDTRVREQIAALPEAQQSQIGDIDNFIQQSVAAQATDFGRAWWPYFLQYNPAEAWAQTGVPILALFGELDVQVDAEQNASALREALERGEHPDFEIVTLTDANHLFQRADTGSVSEYAALQPQFNPEFLPTVTDWILAHVTLP